MKAKVLTVFLIAVIGMSCKDVHESDYDVDICVYGGTSAGVIAAYTAKQQGKSVVLIEPGQRLGGMTSGGLGYTDIGNKYAVKGLALDFYRRIGQHYGKFEQWIFEPKVAKAVYEDYVKRADLDVRYNTRLYSVKKEDGIIREIILENSRQPAVSTNTSLKAKMYIDCSYEGDLMAKAGVGYTVGREDNKAYNETLSGVQFAQALSIYHQFPDGVDPYIIPGKPESGLLWGINGQPLEPEGTGDKKVQAYCFRLCLTSNPENMVPITRPENYDSTKYELLVRFLDVELEQTEWYKHFKPMPNNKTDINSTGAVSTDMIGANYDYPDGSYDVRKRIIKEHEDYTKGLLYFYGHDPRSPAKMREEMAKWGYPKDEYAENGHFSPQLYIREARRMIGEYVMTQHNCQGKEVVDDGIGLAAYGMDSHNCQRVIVNGMVKNEGDVQVGGFPPYPISYRSIIPKKEECTNLLVPVCLSATHMAYGSIRMEPVFMVLGQSAATAASMAIDSKKGVQHIDVKKLQQELLDNPLADKSTSDILVDNDDNGVEISGQWEPVYQNCYGKSMLLSKDGSGSVKFTPSILQEGKYDVYMYIPRFGNMAESITASVSDGKTTVQKIIKASEVIVLGQTSGEWVSLGRYDLQKGKDSFVSITANGSKGQAFADALIWVPVK